MEPVATYKKWTELGRQVKKGSKAKAIIRPLFARDKNKKESTFLTGFKPVNCIFGYSDTEGPEIEFDNTIWNKDLALSKLGIKMIPYSELNGNSQGYACEKGIAINPVAVCPMKTLFHEVAHIVMGHVGEDKDRGIKEFQAETTAHIVMKELGFDFNESESRAYVQGWLKTKPTDADIKAVFTTVDKIIKAGKDGEIDNV